MIYIIYSILYICSTVRREIIVDSEPTMPSAAFDSEEALLPPATAPAVLHDPEVLPTLGAVPHGHHPMVVCVLAVRVSGLLAAIWVIEDAMAVVKHVASLQDNEEDNILTQM